MPEFSYEGSNFDTDEVIFMDPVTDEVYHIPFVDEEKDNGIYVSHVSTYPARQVMGDWARSDHEITSSFTQSDFTGGGQIWDADEGADLNRFWFGTLGTRHPGQMTLPLLSQYHESPEAANLAIPLGDFNQDFYAAFGLNLVTVTDQPPVTRATLAHVPVAKPAPVFSGTNNNARLFIAMGPHGYQHWNGVTLSPLNTDVEPIQFIEWDTKLYALQLNGEVYESVDGVSWDIKFSVPSQDDPRGMIVFYDAQDQPIPYVICRRGVYAVDMSLGKAYKTKLDPPPHSSAGLAAATWREDLFVSYGVGVHQYTGNSIIAMGLDRDDGVPRWMNGQISSMVGGYNGMYCLVQGKQTTTAHLEPSFITDLTWNDFYMMPSSSQPALMMWDGFGWHTVWLPGQATRQPTSLLISVQSGIERLWWGVGNRLYWQDVHHMYHNPQQRDPEARYEKTGWLESSVFDYSMDGQSKILHQLEVMSKWCTPENRILVDYKLDDGPWTPLATITDEAHGSRHRFPAGANGTFPDGVTPRFDGEPFIDIRYRIRMERGTDDTKTPLLESIAVIFHKLMSPLKAFSMTIGIPNNQETLREYKGRTAAELVAFVDRMVNSDRLVPMGYGGVWRSVRFAGSSGTDSDGVDQTGVRTISVVEVLE